MSSFYNLTLLPVKVGGVTYNAAPESTNQDLAADYQRSVAVFVNLFNLHYNDPNNPTDPQLVIQAILNGNYAGQMKAALFGGTVTINGQQLPVTGLLNLLVNGKVNPATGQVNYMTVDMANTLDMLLRSLMAAGVDVTPGGLISAQSAIDWRNLAVTSDVISAILQTAISVSGEANRSLQALVELVYVKTGNQILTDKLGALEKALSTTQQTLNILNTVQQLHNEITILPRIGIKSAFPGLFSAASNPGTFIQRFASATKIQYRAIDPSLMAPLSPAQLSQFQDMVNNLRLEISALSDPAITPRLPDGSVDPQTLLGTVRVVYNDIQNALNAIPQSLTFTLFSPSGFPNGVQTIFFTPAQRFEMGVQKWILDNYSATPSGGALAGLQGGDIQRHLTQAITAGQNLNDTQKEDVRRYLFVFEEYYKSASAVLTKITQIVEKMAQGISR